jgi:hypothetical protein
MAKLNRRDALGLTAAIGATGLAALGATNAIHAGQDKRLSTTKQESHSATHYVPTHDGTIISIQASEKDIALQDLGKILSEAVDRANAKQRKRTLEIVLSRSKVLVEGKAQVEGDAIKKAIENAGKIIRDVDPDCWIDVWETRGYKDRHARFWGPAAYPSLGGWGDEIDALVTGPKCWAVLWEDERFSDTHLPIYPNTRIDDMDRYDFSDQADSMKLYNQKSPEHP